MYRCERVEQPFGGQVPVLNVSSHLPCSTELLLAADAIIVALYFTGILAFVVFSRCSPTVLTNCQVQQYPVLLLYS